METKRVYFPSTTPQQRKLLFETWSKLAMLLQLAEKRMLGDALITTGSPRFEKRWYAGLES